MRYINPYTFTLLVLGAVGVVLGIIVFLAGRNTTQLEGNAIVTGDATAMWNGLIDQQFGIAICLTGAIALIAGTVILGLQWRPH